ncbi:IclR family transcriptional regulator [Paracandidimonas soli]|uniref:IclR family transcriptional regulator n=2 Tax=Paracandidimonas soli TaxID=1917182 RepID=A0A4R3VF15_9BURK|nr:IclR family transcriptional regulator [Paracandidimonas soli]
MNINILGLFSQVRNGRLFMNDHVKSATRVLDLLELFSAATEPMGVTEVARKLDIPKSSAQALLLTLTGRGYLLRDENGYTLPPELRGGWVGGLRTRLLGIAAPILSRMAQESLESAFIGSLTGEGNVQYLAKAVSPKEVRYDASLDHPRPLHCTSMGLAIMAHSPEHDLKRWLQPHRLVKVTSRTQTDPEAIRQWLAKIRKDGYAEVMDANVEGASGASAPIFGTDGRVIAALNLGAPTWRYEQDRRLLIEIVCREAASITRVLSGNDIEGGKAPGN